MLQVQMHYTNDDSDEPHRRRQVNGSWSTEKVSWHIMYFLFERIHSCISMLDVYGKLNVGQPVITMMVLIASLLSLFILMDYIMNNDTIRIELSILHFKALPVKISITWYIDWFNLCKQCRPWWNAALCGISSGSSLFAKYPVYRYPEWMVR